MVTRDMMRSTTRKFEKYYNPELHGEIRLDTNTNVLGSNPAASEFLKHLDINLNGYPNTYSDGLRGALAELYGLEADNFIVGSGSDEMLDVSFKTFTEWGDTCVSPTPSYTLYNYFVEMNGGKAVNVDLDEDFQLDVDAMVKPKAKIMIMPSPNNPKLWKKPEGSLPFAVREAVSSNLCVSASEKALLAENGVWVPTGWRGPYLRLPVGRDELLDPWGNRWRNNENSDRLYFIELQNHCRW